MEEIPIYHAKPILFTAIETGNLDLVKRLVTPNSFFEPDDKGWLPMHHSIKTGHREIFKYLIEQYDSLSFILPGKVNILMFSVLYGDSGMIQDLVLRDNELILLKDEKGNTLLHYCCFSGNQYLFKELLDRDFSLVQTNNDNLTPFELLFTESHFELIDLLKFSRNELDTFRVKGKSVWEYAVVHYNTNLLLYLINRFGIPKKRRDELLTMAKLLDRINHIELLER